MQVDPIRSRRISNLYIYCNDDPLNKFDFTGKAPLDIKDKSIQAGNKSKFTIMLPPHHVYGKCCGDERDCDESTDTGGDSVDEACKQHDICYTKNCPNGWPCPECDKQLCKDAKKVGCKEGLTETQRKAIEWLKTFCSKNK